MLNDNDAFGILKEKTYKRPTYSTVPILCLHHFTHLVFKICQIFCWRYTF